MSSILGKKYPFIPHILAFIKSSHRKHKQDFNRVLKCSLLKLVGRQHLQKGENQYNKAVLEALGCKQHNEIKPNSRTERYHSHMSSALDNEYSKCNHISEYETVISQQQFQHNLY
uniref:Uncharacterized protein n=1 Tax=Anguilla anguilla TaxID=7936 RepID=A0A0E9WXD4_ANGAN